MKGALCGLIASTLLFVVGTSEAWAQKRRVVIEQFTGSGGEKLRQSVASALDKMSGVEVIPDKKVAATEADLGLLTVADSYAAVARELKIAAFVSGGVSGAKKATARVKVRDAEGNLLGEGSWSGANSAKALASADDEVAAKLKELLAGAKPYGGKGGDAVAKAEKPAEKAEKAAEKPVEKVEKAAEKPVEKVAERKEKRAEVAEEKRVAADEAPAEEAPKKKRKKAAAEEAAKPAEEEVAANDDDEEEGDEDAVLADDADGEAFGGALAGLDLSLGTHIYSRNFTYNQNVTGGQQEYKLAAVPAAALAVEYFPIPYAGLTGAFEYSMALISEDNNKDRYSTRAFSWSIGAKGKYVIGGADLMAGVSYGSQLFEVVPMADDPNPPEVAGVDYRHIRAGASVRFPVTRTIALLGGLNYLHLLSAGELVSSDYFPFAKGRGGDGFAGVAVALPWLVGLEARGTVDVRRYVFSMNSADEDLMESGRIAGGAVDQYAGLLLSIAYRGR